MAMDSDFNSSVEAELQRFPAAVLAEYQRAEQTARKRLAEPDFLAWAQEGISIARHSFRSWEAAGEYFKATPEVVGRLSFPDVMRWARWGKVLAADSPVISCSFFRASPEVLNHLNPEDIFQWATLGKGLYKGTWKSSALSSTYFEVSPKLLAAISLYEMEHLVGLIDLISQKSYDAASECLVASDKVFARIERQDRSSFLSLGAVLARGNWRDIKPYFEHAAGILAHVEKTQRGRFLILGEQVTKGHGTNIVTFLLDSSAALAQVDLADHGQILDMAEHLARASPQAVGDFLKSAPQVLLRVRDDQLAQWFKAGLAILKDNEEGGLAFFRLESTRGEQAIEKLSNGVQLERVQEILKMYCRALAGEGVDLQQSGELKEKHIGWNSAEQPSTEGNHIYLPAFIERYGSKEENFGWFKVIATHQAAHLEFASFRFSFDRPAGLFGGQDQRPVLARGQADGAVISDLQRFFNLFQDRRLASDIFTLLEDARLDHRVKQEYPGLRPMYERVQREAVAARPDPRGLPLREALMEVLVRLSLDDTRTIAVPREFGEHVEAIARLVRCLQNAKATVEDTAEATLRLYDVVSRVPNVEAPPEAFDEQDMDEMGEQGDTEDMQKLLDQLQTGGQGQDGSKQGTEDYKSPRKIDFRGDFKPELVQSLANLREAGQRDQSSQADASMESDPNAADNLKAMLENSVEVEIQEAAEDGTVDSSKAMFVNNLMAEAAKQKPRRQQNGQPKHVEESDSPLNAREPLTFLYDEWDFRAGDYKPRWCCVRERRMEEGTSDFFERTLKTNSILVGQIKRQFEVLAPQMLRKIKHLPDGEEYDFDAVVDSIIQRIAGDTPSDKVYWRRNKVDRDVAVAFLLDMSASTAEAIDEGRRQFDTWDFPDDPRDYMTWLRSRREEMTRRTFKRIVDIEKESTVLLIKALESIGDTYGIYGFSGYGRENVEFYVIKDLDEQFGEHVKRRIDRISPMHATRMGPAIRHAAYKLSQQDARTKVLFLLSDGRPQDRGYSREGVEKEYAVQDTRMALLEARRKRITPFCLTVDRAGHDYLKTMMSDMGYEVVADIQSLPKRLPQLYRRLTV